ncbi:hypothetical protein SASPL_107972 [Salvia splendens]|uniref:AB hydrolase-1 domain-containing protein n=1 Tax=Salvia splendens TaxID=180675 RepID=A0A8X8YBE2_SALSN|nr:hypothetical protein SASPL_107972 [Salvia splendens]
MMAKGAWWWEKVRRGVRTVYFMVAMVSSLVVVALPVVVAIVDAVLPCLLVSSFTCVNCYGFTEHLHRYAFKSSLVDIPLVSIIRSLVIICVYTMCDGPALSHGPYLGTVTICSIVSILVLSIKACVFTVHSQLEGEASVSLSRKRIHLKKSWGMPVLFLSSVVFALGHIVVAYRTSCKARRKFSFHRDPEAVLCCKTIFSGYQKVPRSPTPEGKSFRSESAMRRKAPGLVQDDGELPVSLLADKDSLFLSCLGLTVHYKIHMPGSPSRSLSSTTLFDAPSLRIPLKTQYGLHRSISNQFYSNVSPLDTPLLASTPTSPISEDMPVLSLHESFEKNELSNLGSPMMERNGDAIEHCGIVLVHGFGGGVFSWRKVMSVLAGQTGCPVAAFDRPGWGLTSRPRKKDWEENQLPNPYKFDSQVDLLLSFCMEMFSSVVLIGHDDGGLLALKAVQKLRSSANPVNTPLHVEGWDQALHEIGKLSYETVLQPQTAALMLNAVEALPVLVIAGAEDALVPLKSVQTLASKLLNSVSSSLFTSLISLSPHTPDFIYLQRMVSISGCGHLPHEECPKALLATISPFISKLLLRPELQRQ